MSVQKYRKKPVVIEALQLPDYVSQSVHIELKDFFGEGWESIWNGEFDMSGNAITIGIQTLEGVMTATEGDYIIKGVKGEFYPCKPDIFEMTYEKAE